MTEIWFLDDINIPSFCQCFIYCLFKSTGITSSTVSPTIGQNFSFWCKYPENVNTAKFICKGEDPSICQRLATTNYTTNRFSMKDNTEKTNITVTVTEVTAEDAGIYWCGAERTNNRTSNTFFHRLSMTVGELFYCVVVLSVG